MKNKIYFYYLANYKSIHHGISILMMATLLIFINSFIVQLPLYGTLESLIFCLLMLYVNFKVTKFTLKKSGLDDQVEKEIEEIKKKQTS